MANIKKDPITGKETVVPDSTNITSDTLEGQDKVLLPEQPTDSTNYNGIITGGNTETKTVEPEWWTKYMSDNSAPTNPLDSYNKAYTSSGIDEKQQSVNDLTAQLDSINASATSQSLSLEDPTKLGGAISTSGFLNRQQQEINRQAAIKALPIQAQLSAAQGNLTAAQSKLDKTFEIQQNYETQLYNYKKDLKDKIYEFATTQEKAKLDKQAKEDERNFTLFRDSIADRTELANKLMENGQADVAAKVAKLDPKSSTYSKDLASLQAQYKEKPSDVGALPTSYKEWQLAGSPGTFADYLSKTNVKAATVAQQTVAGYASRLEQAEPILKSVTDNIVKMNPIAFEATKDALPTFQSSEMQQYMQSARNFINSVLRRESGAVISPSEFAEARKQYLPQPGDTKEALKLKEENRKLVLAGYKNASGSAYTSINELLGTYNDVSLPGSTGDNNFNGVELPN